MNTNVKLAEELMAPRRELYRHKNTKPGAIPCDDNQFDALCDAVGLATRCVAEEKHFIVTNACGWGRGKTLVEAKRNCRRNNPRLQSENVRLIYRAKLVHPETTIDSNGSINYPAGCPPIELGEV